MVIYKFGGASVKNSDGVKNLLNIVREINDELIIVISAFGKTTNALEELLKLSLNEKPEFEQAFNKLKEYHFEIIHDPPGKSRVSEVFISLKPFFVGLSVL